MSTKPIHSELVEPTESAAGFTLAELLIVLVVMGILLAAVAVAFNASLTNYRENEDIFKSVNKARQALSRITNQLRDANSVDPCSPISECALETSEGSFETYRYNNGDNKLYLDVNGNSYVLCDNVTAVTFDKTLTTDGVEVKSVQISMTVGSGNTQRTISAAAVIRRNLP
jgi:prepilin-type N-terminal cleavage/methylation domain-containing protein